MCRFSWLVIRRCDRASESRHWCQLYISNSRNGKCLSRKIDRHEWLCACSFTLFCPDSGSILILYSRLLCFGPCDGRFMCRSPDSCITYIWNGAGTPKSETVPAFIYLPEVVCVCAREPHIRQPFRVLRNYDDAPFSIRVVHNIVSDLVPNRFNFLCAATVFRSYTCYMHYFPTHRMKIEQPGRFSSMPNCREFSFEHLMFPLVFSCDFLRFYWFRFYFFTHSHYIPHKLIDIDKSRSPGWHAKNVYMHIFYNFNRCGRVASFVVRRRLWFSQFAIDALRFMHSTSKILLHIIYF